jgi:hypothetical protein
MAKRKLQMELSSQQKSVVMLHTQKGESQHKLAEQFQRRQLQTLRKMNTPL